MFKKAMLVSKSRRYDLFCRRLRASLTLHQNKKKRSTRRVAEDSDIIVPVGDQMEIDVKPVVPRVRDLDVNFVDDDELQAALASARRAKVKTKKISPEEIARRS
jgi:U4/U6.U5 tri-snRNP-associated protein 1